MTWQTTQSTSFHAKWAESRKARHFTQNGQNRENWTLNLVSVWSSVFTMKSTSSHRRPQPFPIRLDPIPRDPRLAFVNNVCELLLESRFGPDRCVDLAICLSEKPEAEPHVFYYVTEDGPIAAYLPESLRDSSLPPLDIARLTAENARIDGAPRYIAPAARSAPGLGRGSPPPCNQSTPRSAGRAMSAEHK